jgi:ADP-ribose pyrophosphatase YjhB (NUDIX family)
MNDPVDYNYCPRCGHALHDGQFMGKTQRMCAECGFIHFHDPKVAVVVLVTRDGRVLMVKRGMEPERGKWALPAGFVDYGEDPRAAARRETKEETGFDVEISELIDVLGPDKPGEGSNKAIAILFEADILGGELTAQDDVDETRFFAPDEIPYAKLAFQSTHILLRRWLES